MAWLASLAGPGSRLRQYFLDELAQFHDDLHAVPLRHVEVGDDQVEWLGLQDGARLETVGRFGDRIASAREAFGKHLPKLAIILNNKNLYSRFAWTLHTFLALSLLLCDSGMVSWRPGRGREGREGPSAAVAARGRPPIGGVRSGSYYPFGPKTSILSKILKILSRQRWKAVGGAGRRVFCTWPALARSLQPAVGMLGARRLGHGQNPSPQASSSF